MSRIRDLLKDSQIYCGGLNITGEKTKEIIAALEADEKELINIADDLQEFLKQQLPFINGNRLDPAVKIYNRLRKLAAKSIIEILDKI